MNKINSLLEKQFSSLSLEEKVEVKQLGRPIPDLNIVKTQTSKAQKSRCRKFNADIYCKNQSICGCEVKNMLYCFPCVLFGGETTWAKSGTSDLVHIWEKMARHEKSKSHIANVFSLSMLGKTNITTQLNSAYRQSLIKHNEQVDKNRYILNIIINCLRFCGKLELALRGHDETNESENKGVFRELIDFTAEFDKDLKTHLDKSYVFKGTSKSIQNELLQSMLLSSLVVLLHILTLMLKII